MSRIAHAPVARSRVTVTGLSPRRTREARARLAQLCLIVAGASVLASGVAALQPIVHDATVAAASATAAVCLGLACAALGMWWAARRSSLSDAAVLDLGLLFQIGGCLACATAAPVFVTRAVGQIPEANPAVLWILLHPAVVPTPFRRTVLASFTAALMFPLGLALATTTGITPTSAEIAPITFVPLIAAVLATWASTVVHGLAVDADEAERLGSYRLEHRIATGGMGEVWRARHASLARPAAVKLIRREVAADDGVLEERFDREARLTASLRSPHTVVVYDYGTTEDGRFYYAMELLDGLDLATLVHHHGPQPASRVVHALLQACHSLDEAHARGLVHRDIKPANLMLCRYGRERDFLKVLDFGLAKRPVAADDDPDAHSLVGTPGFMAPELDAGLADARSDLFGLGCVAYALLTGEPPFPSADDGALPAPPSTKAPGPVPPGLDAVILACLSADPAARPVSARALADRLAALPVPAWTEREAAAWWADHAPVPPLLPDPSDVFPPDAD